MLGETVTGEKEKVGEDHRPLLRRFNDEVDCLGEGKASSRVNREGRARQSRGES